jgi:predicted dehydrogenase
MIHKDSRRNFLRKTGKGALLSTMALSTIPSYSLGRFFTDRGKAASMRIGIIGAENSHTVGYGKLFNIDKKFPGMEVQYVWGETEAFARRAVEQGNIPHMVSDPKDMLGRIDALIVDHRHAKYHLDAAEPFVKAGIPTFIDKPFCYRVSAGKEFLAMAREAGTAVTSFSSRLQSDATFDMKKQLETLGDFQHIICFGPADLDSVYGGIFFYGVHIVEPMLFLFGENVTRARVSRNGQNASASLCYDDGKLATLIFTDLSHEWETFVETEEGIIELKSSVEESDPRRNYTDMVEMFRTGKEPRSHRSILAGVAVLEALERSAITGDWVDVPDID